jgi:hypothetical protein
MITPPEETTLVALPAAGEQLSSPSADLARYISDSLQECALHLPAELGLGRLLVGIMQGSGFSGALMTQTSTSQAKVLISPEELSLSMTCKLMEDMDHE